MHYCWMLLGMVLGWCGRSLWMSRRSRQPIPASMDGDADMEVGNSLGRVRAGIARQYRDIESTIEQIEDILREAGGDSGTIELSHKLQESKKALSSYLAASYDTLRTLDPQALTAGPLPGQDRAMLHQFLKERLATRERYQNPFAVVMFFLDAVTAPHETLNRILSLIRITDRAFMVNRQEYLVVLPETDLDGAQVFAARCVASLTEVVGAQVCAGVAVARDGDGPRQLLNRVDTALYRARCDEGQFVFSHDGQRMEPYVSCEAGISAGSA